MISREDYAVKNTISESIAYKEEITFAPVTRVSNAPVIIEVAVFGRKVRRVYMDSGSTCEVIYEHCFEKLNPTIKATRVNTKTPIVGFLGKRSWSVGEVPLEIIIREHPLSRTETLNFVIVKPDSPHNMLLGRTAMQKMRIVVSTIHEAIKFYTKKEGIKSNPTKIKAVTKLEQPRVLKDIQSLNKKLAALSHFLSKGAERSLPFFKVLKSCKGKKKIHWTNEADKAFKEIKKFVQALPMLTAPRAGETLTMYLTESKESINVVLFAKISEEQIPIYFESKVLQGAELNYLALEKLILALVHAARRLRRYFQAHTIMVPTGMPIKQALTGPEKTGRVAKWAIELGEHDIIFLKRDKRETPADFLPKIPFDDSEKKVKEKEVPYLSNEWKLYTDGASSPIGAGAGLMLIDLAGKEYTYALRFEFETTNNEAEYEALLARLCIAQEIEITKVAIFLDSQLVVNQIKGTCAVKQLSIKSYLQKVKPALNGFEGYTVEHVRRNQNKKVDALNKLASMTFEHLTKEVLVEVLAKRSIEEKEFLKVEIKEKRSWISPIQEYLLTGLLPEDTKEARKIGIQVPQEVAKAIQDYNKCKEQSAIWKAGADRAIAVGIEHSTKWVEAKPITIKNARQVEKFVWEYVVYRFRVPRMISSKEEKHFKEGIFADFYKGLKIMQTFSPIMEYMQIMHYIEKQLVQSQQGWVDNLAKELWVHRTLLRNSQEETPFSLTYGFKAVVPIVEATDDRGRTQETTKKGKEIASIKKAHYRNKLRKYHNTRNNYSNYIVRDFVLFPTSSQEQQGPHMISEVHKDGFYTLVNIADHSLIQKAKGTSLRKFYM
ncbi:reverse transcriptase domain-containing protein [Tanacetum coccineum]